MTQPPYAGTLLIVDDREDIRRAMARYFSLYFEAVYVAATPNEAENILQKYSPTFLLCDYWLGEDFPPSTALIPGWRQLAPSIKSVALMTGTKISAIGSIPCVDAVFQKPLEPSHVVDFFLGRNARERSSL